MIARTSALVGAISGSLGSITAKNTRTGLVLAHRPAKINPQTQSQLTVRTSYSFVVRTWKARTDAHRLAWNRLATTFPHTNSLGVSRALSGFQLFVKFNLPWTIIHQAPLDVIPSALSNTPPYNITADYVFGDVFNLSYWVDPQTGPARPVISFGRTFSTSKPKFFHNYRFILEGRNDAGLNEIQLEPTLSTIVGKPQLGEWVFTRLHSIDSFRFPSFPVAFATQVT